MPLVFLISYIVISYFIYKKNKNDIENIPLILYLTGIIAFALLFVFLVYYGDSSSSLNTGYKYMLSFYLLFFSYVITFIVYLFKYKKKLNENKSEIEFHNNRGIVEIVVDKTYFVIILFFSFLYFFSTNPLEIYSGDGVQILLYMFFIFSSIYILFEDKILSLKK